MRTDSHKFVNLDLSLTDCSFLNKTHVCSLLVPPKTKSLMNQNHSGELNVVPQWLLILSLSVLCFVKIACPESLQIEPIDVASRGIVTTPTKRSYPQTKKSRKKRKGAGDSGDDTGQYHRKLSFRKYNTSTTSTCTRSTFVCSHFVFKTLTWWSCLTGAWIWRNFTTWRHCTRSVARGCATSRTTGTLGRREEATTAPAHQAREPCSKTSM